MCIYNLIRLWYANITVAIESEARIVEEGKIFLSRTWQQVIIMLLVHNIEYTGST